MKICKVCGETKSIDAFHRNKAAKDGRRSKCKECAYEYNKSWWKKNKDRFAAAYKLKRDQNRVKRAEASRRWQKNHPEQYAAMKLKHREANREKYRAMYRVFKAIKRGDLFPQPCEVCAAKAMAHHEDYEKPYDVRWLCSIHHTQRHEEIRAANLQ